MKRTDASQERGSEGEGRREKIRVPPMSEMLQHLERDAHTWDRWEVFTLKPEYQMPSWMLARSLKTQVDPREKAEVLAQGAHYRENLLNSLYSIQILAISWVLLAISCMHQHIALYARGSQSVVPKPVTSASLQKLIEKPISRAHSDLLNQKYWG